jgi:urea transporter
MPYLFPFLFLFLFFLLGLFVYNKTRHQASDQPCVHGMIFTTAIACHSRSLGIGLNNGWYSWNFDDFVATEACFHQ